MFESTKMWNAVDSSRFDKAKVGSLDMLPKYEKKDVQLFLGAWYRKIVAPTDLWLGIEGTITLGEFIPDEERFNLDGKNRYMDVASIYMGGNAGFESDCGLGMNTTYLDSDTSYELGLDAKKMGYRPFYRYIYKYMDVIGPTVNRHEVNSWNTSDPKELNHVYFPGDTVRMRVFSPLPNYIQLKVELIEKTTIPKYKELREKYNLPDNTDYTYYSPIMMSEGQGVNKGVYKRVNSIDQYGNEGFGNKNTNAKVSECVWHNCYLFKEVNNELLKFPFTSDLYSFINCPDAKAFTVIEFENNNGGEKIEIHPETYRYKG